MTSYFVSRYLPQILTTLFLLGVGLFAILWGKQKNYRLFALLCFSIAIWSAGNLGVLSANTIEEYLFWDKLIMPVVMSVPVIWFIFIFQYTGRENWITKINILLLSFLPLLFLISMLLNFPKAAVYQKAEVISLQGLSYINIQYGPLLWFILGYFYMMLLFALILLVRFAIDYPKSYRVQAFINIFIIILPWLGNTIDFMNTNNKNSIILAPLAFLLTSPVLIWALFKKRFMDPSPVANEIILRNIQAGVVVIDNHQQIISTNQYFQDLLNLSKKELLGAEISQIIKNWPGFPKDLEFNSNLERTYNYYAPALNKYFETRISTLYSNSHEMIGRLLYIQDISTQKETVEVLRRQNVFLEALNEMALGILNRLDLNAVLQSILQQVTSMFNIPNSYIAILQKQPGKPDQLQIHVATGIFEKYIGLHYVKNQGITGRVWANVKTLVIEDYAQWENRLSFLETTPFHSIAASPLKSGDEVIGVLGIASTQKGKIFTQEEVFYLEKFVQLVSIAVDNARLYSSLQHQLAERRLSEYLYRSTSNALEEWIHIIDHDYNIILINKAMEKVLPMLGYDPENILYQNLFLAFPFIAEHYKEEYAWVFENGQEMMKVDTTNLNGQTYITETKKIPIIENDKVSRIITVMRDITAQKMAEDQIRSALAEKETLLREIHHRVKNNLQMISGLLSLQSEYLSDPQARAIFEETQHRLHTISIVHEDLYQSRSLSKINIAQYIPQLASNIHSAMANNPNVHITTNAADVMLNLEQAIPCGLIINELISNALKYAFPNKQQGELLVELKELEEQNNQRVFQLIVADNGVGLPKDFSIEKSTSLGLQFVDIWVKQLHADLKIDNQNGARFEMIFKTPL
jgi:PAS domain S-box-containing protein